MIHSTLYTNLKRAKSEEDVKDIYIKALGGLSDAIPVDFSEFETIYQALTEKLRPQVFELGFLK